MAATTPPYVWIGLGGLAVAVVVLYEQLEQRKKAQAEADQQALANEAATTGEQVAPNLLDYGASPYGAGTEGDVTQAGWQSIAGNTDTGITTPTVPAPTTAPTHTPIPLRPKDAKVKTSVAAQVAAGHSAVRANP